MLKIQNKAKSRATWQKITNSKGAGRETEGSN